MTSEPLVSCLTVTQPGRLAELERSASCFARQSYPHRELVLVHDGDEAFDHQVRRVLDATGALPHRVLRVDPGLPLGVLRNLSVKGAVGDLVCQWDDDDLYHPERLALQYRHLVETGVDFSFLTDQLHWFLNTGEFFWDDWNVEPRPMNLIQGTIMGRRELMPRYPALTRGEDTTLLEELHRQGAKLAGLAGRGYLYIYVFTGKNSWEFVHHGAISNYKRVRQRVSRLHAMISSGAFGSTGCR
ncbi:MAG: glycosyltransferase family 2 protein [Gammaproteobacteria bacterium]|nr:glycosyltransferase family 2 protein [Gammaproteobacteria bacterium]